MLDGKLQIRDGQTIAVLHSPYPIALAARAETAESADAVLVFAVNRAELEERIDGLAEAAKRGALTWLAYPKAKQLGTDLNRDIIHALMPSKGLDTVRQVAIDDTWSALRLRYTGS